MSSHFSANQFERTFKARRLGNWETPTRWHLERPRTHCTTTKFITNDRGHLLPHVPRSTANPWGYFKNTWQLPDKISKKQIDEIIKPQRGIPEWYQKKLDIEKKECEARMKAERERQKQKQKNKLQKSTSLDLEYIPGDFTEPKYQHPSRELLLQQKYERDNNIPASNIHPPNQLYLEKHECTDPIALLEAKEEKERNPSPHVLGDNVEDNFKNMRLTLNNQKIPEKPNEQNIPPVIPAYCNFQIAKKMHQENLEHQPLPDSITDQQFKKLLSTAYPYPGLDLMHPVASGVGVKVHKAGPTHCTKMKIYRPKTCGVIGPKLPLSGNEQVRPQTVVNKKMGSMDLAICWDFRPANARDEPKRPKHIDGSNESAGPAVFTVVRTPRTPENVETGRTGGIFTNTFGEISFFDKNLIRKKANFGEANASNAYLIPHQHQSQVQRNTNISADLKCTCGTSPISFTNAPGSDRSRSKSFSRDGSAISENRKRHKSSPNISRLAVSEEQSKENIDDYRAEYLIEKVQGRHGKQHTCSKYGPKKFQNERTNSQPGFFHRTARLCHKVAPHPEETQKELFKAAFKAGTLNSSDSGCSTTCSSMQQPAQKVLIIPRPRNPYNKKNYNIDTLVPPFTCYKGGAGQGGYPEHWRLASVYQHAYKPIQQRHRPLLATVYK